MTISKKTITSALFLGALGMSTALSPQIASAVPINLGDAADYNVFVRNGFSVTTGSIRGRLAAGGDVSIGPGYSVNSQGGGTPILQTDSRRPAVAVGGNLNFKGGDIAGDVYVAGRITRSSGTSMGNLQRGGTPPIDFGKNFDRLNKLSKDLSELKANGTVNRPGSGQLRFQGSGKNGKGGDTHVFSLKAADLSTAYTDFLLNGIDPGDKVIFNVSGKNINNLSWGNFAGSDSSIRRAANHIVYNFFEATKIALRNRLFGNILAPKADVSSDTSSLDGRLMAKSFAGKNASFTVAVSEPGSFALMGLGIILLAGWRRRELDKQ